MERLIKFKLLGMDTDSDVSTIEGTSSLYNYNVRFTVTDEGLLNAAISNERGTDIINEINIDGVPIGYSTLNDFIVIFVTEAKDATYKDGIYIYKYVEDLVSHKKKFTQYYTYLGNFNFNVKNPIECLVVWERLDLLKVFWVDGENPLRFLTVPKEAKSTPDTTRSLNYFNAVKELDFNTDLESSINVTRLSFGGTFPAGTILYVFTYYAKYGTESNIFKTTPLFYISNSDSGIPADRSATCSFLINVSDVDKSGNWDFLRIYSIRRTAINGEPVCKKVVDLDIKNFTTDSPITYVDTGEYGETIDSTRLLYVGGERIAPSTIALKDGTLFLGNYKIIRPEINNSAKTALKNAFNTSIIKKQFFKNHYLDPNDNTKKIVRKVVPLITDKLALKSTYQYTSLLSNPLDKITTFKSGESYRIGVQLLDKTGKWSEPIFLFDTVNNTPPETIHDNLTNFEVDSGDLVHKVKAIPELDKNLRLPFDFKNFEDNFEETMGGGSMGSSNPSKSMNADVKAFLAFGHIKMNLLDIIYNDSNILEYFKSLGYLRIRPVIVYPNSGNKEVLFLGVANPTVKKGPTEVGPTGKRGISSLDYRIPSWFYRPIESNNSDVSTLGHYGHGNVYTMGSAFKGVYPIYKDGLAIPYYLFSNKYNNVQAEFLYETQDTFLIDWSVLTIDSPDIRFDELLSLNNLENVKARVVGLVDIAGNSASYSIAIDGGVEPPEDLKSKNTANVVPLGNKIEVPFNYLSGEISSFNYGACLINYPFWLEGFSDNGERGYDSYLALWYIYPWHRKGSLNNNSRSGMSNVEGADRPSMLKRKILANSRFGFNTVYGFTNKEDLLFGYLDLDVKHAKVFILTSTNQIDRFPDGTLFKNQIDVVLPASGLPSFRAIAEVTEGSSDSTDLNGNTVKSPIVNFRSTTSSPEYPNGYLTTGLLGDKYEATVSNILRNMFGIGVDTEKLQYFDPLNDNWGNLNTYHIGNDPIPMLFKTGSNCVILLSSPLSYDNLKFTYDAINTEDKLFKSVAFGHWLPIIELYRVVENKFGGNSDDALKQNAWLVAGSPVNLENNIDLFWDYGDTYFLRYDCLKTMPYNDSSTNNIVEILSFFCETRINIDGRYDVNRGLQDNTTVNANNFNQLNDSYTQDNNYFQYYMSDADLALLNFYRNLLIWSLTKTSGDEIDPWTNITLLNYLDLDGDKGLIRAIKNFNGLLYVFQDAGIAGINYNLNVMLNSEQGVPVEIANSGKVTGSVYLSTTLGCLNKYSIVDVSLGLVFLDLLNSLFNLFDGRLIVDLGLSAKFSSWIKKHCGSIDLWNPLWRDINSETVTFLYDRDVNEILLTSKDFSVAYNLGLMKFTSFYSYEACPWLINSNSELFIFGKNDANNYKAWHIRLGDYNKFFGSFKPYKIKFVASDSKYFDYLKLFSVIEVRDTVTASKGDTYEGDPSKYVLLDTFSFDTILVTNSYLDSGSLELKFLRNVPSNLKPKFRAWRIEVPRNSKRGMGRIKDRMRDYYMTIDLAHNKPSYDAVKIHDIISTYLV